MEKFAFSLPEVPQMSGINFFSARPPSAPAATQAQSVQTHQQSDQFKALDIMKDMLTGKISASDGLKKLQDLVENQAKAQATLAPGAPASAPASAPTSVSASSSSSSSSGSTGFSTTDTFEAGGASKPAVDLLGLAGGGATQAPMTAFLDSSAAGASAGAAGDTSAGADFLDQGGGGAKPGIGSGSNRVRA